MEPVSAEADTLILISINAGGQVNFSTKGPVVTDVKLTAEVSGKKYTFIVNSDDQDGTSVNKSFDSTQTQNALTHTPTYERPPNQPNGY